MPVFFQFAIVSLLACGGSTPPAAETVKPAPVVAAPATKAAKATKGLPARKDDADQSSKNGRSEATIGPVNVVVTYGRPVQKGRVLFGELVPYGKVWRTGANEATALSLSDDVMFAGESVEAGVYGLFTIPGEKEWTIVLNGVAEQWGAYDYDSSKDVLRVSVPAAKHAATEIFTIEASGAGLAILWGETRVAVPITAQ